MILSKIGGKKKVLPEVRISVNISFHFAFFTPIHRSRSEFGMTVRLYSIAGPITRIDKPEQDGLNEILKVSLRA